MVHLLCSLVVDVTSACLRKALSGSSGVLVMQVINSSSVAMWLSKHLGNA